MAHFTWRNVDPARPGGVTVLAKIVFPTIVVATIVCALAAHDAGARPFPGPRAFVFDPAPFFDLRPIEDQLEIVERGDQLLAIDAWSGSAAIAYLGTNEVVLWSDVRGRVALAITDLRVLAAVPGASGWREREIGVFESSPVRVVLGDRVALLATDRRVLAFEGLSGAWSESSLGPREQVLLAGAGTNVAVAVTRTRVLGVAAARGGLFEAELGIREEAEALRVHGSFATVTTKLRILTFRAPDGNWQSTELPFR